MLKDGEHSPGIFVKKYTYMSSNLLQDWTRKFMWTCLKQFSLTPIDFVHTRNHSYPIVILTCVVVNRVLLVRAHLTILLQYIKWRKRFFHPQMKFPTAMALIPRGIGVVETSLIYPLPHRLPSPLEYSYIGDVAHGTRAARFARPSPPVSKDFF